MSGRRWTEQEKKLAYRMLAAGVTLEKIGVAVGRTKHAVKEFFLRQRRDGQLEPAKVARRTPGEPHHEQICWDCAKANGSGDCEWANSKCTKTVPGWIAKEVSAPRGGEGVTGATPWYQIYFCPKFEKG